ncbi:HTTM domain-containing protein [Streptomyces sp. NPDC051940]|uniref:HTTM domain-containing protein n=1 Tax=Streptomyces sp. NPDC051940 TaxID=3155675 RepID=UPI003449AA31
MIRTLRPRLDAALDRATVRPYSLYSAAALRVGTGLLALAYLLRDIANAPEMWGPDAYWTPEMALRLNELNGWTPFYTIAATDSAAAFWLIYAGAVAASAAFTLGWRTRATSVVFAVLLCAVQFRNTFVNDSGDHVVRLFALYLTCTACGRVWSLDARRRARYGDPGPGDGLRERLTALLHNTALLVVAGQVMIAYGSAGMYKVQGETWQHGTALYYALQLNAFRPWPEVSDWVTGHGLLILGLAYLTVFAQLGLPFAVFSRLKYPFLIGLVASHAGIAVLMGLPLFSAAMVIGDTVFLPDRFWRRAARLVRRLGPVPAKPAGPPPEGTAPRPRTPEPAGEAAVRRSR